MAKNKFFKHRLIEKFVFIAIFFLYIFTRFYKLYQFFTFNFDEEYQAFLAWEQVKHFHKIWIGVSASNVNYYLGPFFTYLNALLFYISKDPVVLGMFGSIFGLITALSIYFVAKKLFSQKAALTSFAFYTGSLFFNMYDRRFWNPTPIAFISIWLLYSLYRFQKNDRWLIVIFALMGISLHVHLSMLAFWPVIICLMIIKLVVIRKKPFITILNYFQLIITSIVGFIFVTFPLLVFDIVHSFDNFLMPFRYIKIFLASPHNSNFSAGKNQLLNIFSRIWFIKPYSDFQNELTLGVHSDITPTYLPLSVLSVFIFLWILYKAVKDRNIRILAFSMLCIILSYIFYPGVVAPYYLLGYLALFAMTVGIFFSQFSKYLTLTIFIVFLAVNLLSLMTLRQEKYGLLTRKVLIQKTMTVIQNKTFYLETYSEDGRKYHSTGGWRYLFKTYGKTPTQSHADEFFGWIYKSEISTVKPELRVIISEAPIADKKYFIAQFHQGVYFAYIIKNY